MSAESVLELRDATVVKGNVRILDALTLAVRAGEHTAIVGPNGSGKSTFMQLLTHECAPLAGSNGVSPIRVFGNDRWNVFELRSRLGIVSAALHDGFVRGNCTGQISGLDAVLSGLFASKGIFSHHTVTQTMRRQAADALALMGASLLADKKLGEMSTGEARRVLIARALVTGDVPLAVEI